MAKKKIPEINAGSMADISFLLLIFYLVSTTMNVDSGISRMLPPLVDQPQEQSNQIKERNMFAVFVDAEDNLMVQRQRVTLDQLCRMTREFIMNPNNEENKPEKEMKEINLIGEFPVSKAVISLRNDRQTSYDMYIKVQNELVRAVNEEREALALSQFGIKWEDLTDDQKKAISEAIPSRISEAEPRDRTTKSN